MLALSDRNCDDKLMILLNPVNDQISCASNEYRARARRIEQIVLSGGRSHVDVVYVGKELQFNLRFLKMLSHQLGVDSMLASGRMREWAGRQLVTLTPSRTHS